MRSYAWANNDVCNVKSKPNYWVNHKIIGRWGELLRVSIYFCSLVIKQCHENKYVHILYSSVHILFEDTVPLNFFGCSNFKTKTFACSHLKQYFIEAILIVRWLLFKMFEGLMPWVGISSHKHSQYLIEVLVIVGKFLLIFIKSVLATWHRSISRWYVLRNSY